MLARCKGICRPPRLAASLILPLLMCPTAKATSFGETESEVLVNTTSRHAEVHPTLGEIATGRLRVEVPGPGLLALDLSISGGSVSEPVLHLSPPQGGARLLAQTPTLVVLATLAAGPLHFRVANVSPDLVLPAFKLRVSFQAGNLAEGEDAVDPWDDDIDDRKPPQPAPLMATGPVLCPLGEQDDHGDVLACATFIRAGDSLPGTIRNGWGDDEDIFTFDLPSAAILTATIESESPLQLALRSRAGMIVAAAGESLHLTRALPAGRYFLEVEGQNGSEGFYRLILLSSDGP